MTENELIKNLKQLKQIKPNQDWVSFSKSQILGQPPTTFREVSLLSILFSPKKWWGVKPAYATITLLILLVVAVFGFVLTKEEMPVKIAEVIETENLEKIVIKTEEQKQIILVLEKLQTEMTQVTEEIKKIEGPQQALEVRNDIIPKLNAARNTLTEIEKIKLEENKDDILTPNVLATINIINETEEALNNRNKEIAGQLIKDLETRTLTKVQQEILEKAKQAYQDGDYNVALINAMFVSQLRER